MPKTVVLALTAGLIPWVGAPALGQSVREPDLENIVVTAARVALPVERVASSLTVISREQLELRQPTFVADALRDVPGLAVSRGGGFGAVTQVRIRGTEGNHALVLIDGVEANNPVSNSEFDFANLLAADVERIEILRGPQSALYGSDAVGGVINVIMRERNDGFGGSLTSEAGNLGTQSVGASLGGGNERFSGGAAWTHLSTDGQNLARSGDEADGAENDTISLYGRARLGRAISLRGNLSYMDSAQDFDSQDFEFPARPTQGLLVDDDVSSRMEQWFGRVVAAADHGRLSHRLGASGTRTRGTFLDADTRTGGNEGHKDKLDYQLTIDLSGRTAPPAPRSAIGAGSGQSEREASSAGTAVPAALDHAVTLAVEHERVDFLNHGASPEAPENQRKRDRQTSVVGEYRAALGRASVSAGGRVDRNELFDDASTYRLTGAFDVTESTRVHASLGTGIANPGFFELFGFFPGSFVGNPALRPESSTGFDVGVRHRFAAGRASLDVTYFRADLEDEIVTSFDSTTFMSTVDNLAGRSKRRGTEVEFGAIPTPRWRISGTYTYTDAEQPDGTAELRRPRHVASLDNSFTFAAGRARLNVGIDYTGAQLDTELIFATPTDRAALRAFTLVNVSGDYRLDQRWRLHARVENLLDEDYEEWFSYRGRGRALVAGFTVDLAHR